MVLLSEIYDVTLKRGIRSANKDIWVRPTIGECYKTNFDFKKIPKRQPTVLDANKTIGAVLSNGNLDVAFSLSGKTSATVDGNNEGKWYWEVTYKHLENSTKMAACGIALCTSAYNTYFSYSGDMCLYMSNGEIWNMLDQKPSVAPYENQNDKVIGMALDLDNYTMAFYLDGVLQHTADITTLANSSYINYIYPVVKSVARAPQAFTWSCNFGQNSFAYSVPDGYSAGFFDKAESLPYRNLLTQNLTYTCDVGTGPENVANNDLSSCWSSGWATGFYRWIQVDLVEPKTAVKCRVSHECDAGPAYYNRAPRNTSVLGSNDLITWDSLGVGYAFDSWPGDGIFTEYDLTNNTAYRYYRLRLAASTYPPNGSQYWTTLGGWELHEAV